MTMRAAVALVLLVPLLAGCFSAKPAEPLPITAGFVLDLPVHVVAVGFPDFDEAALETHLIQPPPVYNVMRAFTTALVEPAPLQYRIHYNVHDAPAEFATALFAFAQSASAKDEPDAYLAQYDRAREQRVCPASDLPALPPLPAQPPTEVPMPPCEEIDRIDANAVEEWLSENRAAYGLEFGGASHTIFVLDSYTNGYLPRDSYHQYSIGAEFGRTAYAPYDMRAWGGHHDFVFVDVGAAPNAWDDQPWRAAGLTDQSDWPIWEYANDMGQFYENLGRNVVDAVSFLWARDPLFQFEYAPKYVFPTYVIIDSTSMTNPASPLHAVKPYDIQSNTREDEITGAFRGLLPWAEIEMPFTYLVLPDDDPALAEAVADAKQRYTADAVDIGVVKNYVREHWDEYVPTESGAVVYPIFAFWFGEPTVAGASFLGGDEWGDPWGVFFSIADGFRACVPPERAPCTVVDLARDDDVWWRVWNSLFVRQLGYILGLAEFSGTLDPDGTPVIHLNRLWESTASAMTHRHTVQEFGANDVQVLYRNHAAAFALDVLAKEGGAAGSARASALDALNLLRKGEDQLAFETALAAKHASGQNVGSAPLDLVAGEPRGAMVEFPMGYGPVGRPPRAPPIGYPEAPEDFWWQQVEVEVPTDATAVKFEMRERDAPSHRFWSAGLEIYGSDGEWVTGAYDNAYDAVVLLNMARCGSGCTVWMYADSGVASAYDVTVTPLYGGDEPVPLVYTRPPPPPGLDEPVTYEFTGHVNVPGCYAEADPALDAVVRDRVEFEFEVPADTRFINGTLDWGTTGPVADVDVFLYGAEGQRFRDDVDETQVGRETFGYELQEGDQGSWTALVQNCENPPTDFTLEIVLS